MNVIKMLFGGNGISPSEVEPRLKDYYVLDVRQPEEFQIEHIDGAKLIPLNQLPKKLGTLPRDKEILCVCRSGSRSGAAVRHLTGAGYKAVNLSGGIVAWRRAGLPLKKGKK
ncbi:MAG: rhodanese-like domain-containing protein [Anaerolineae bacterium]|nr:MAG: rhodanese-like domain-containing protein [Anaerolineae bacterium]MCL4880068.1 rhodanese-like domain-containing protein [Anaerolineae bacterium]